MECERVARFLGQVVGSEGSEDRMPYSVPVSITHEDEAGLEMENESHLWRNLLVQALRGFPVEEDEHPGQSSAVVGVMEARELSGADAVVDVLKKSDGWAEAVHGGISSPRAVIVLDHCEVLYQSGLWATQRMKLFSFSDTYKSSDRVEMQGVVFVLVL